MPPYLMVVKFEDKIYETDVKIDGDSVVYLNIEYAEIYSSRISVLPGLVTVMTTDEDGVTYVEYLENQNEVEKKYDFIQVESEISNSEFLNTRSNVIDLTLPDDGSTILSIAELYDDKNFKDTVLKSYLTNTGYTSCPYLKGLGFNDKCSSIKVFNFMDPNRVYSIYLQNALTGRIYQNLHYGRELRPVLISYENTNYGGKVLYCIGPVSGSDQVHMDSNLKSIGWNDKNSAISWRLVYNFSVFSSINGEEPEIPAHSDC